MAYLAPTEFVTKMIDAGESKIFMSTRDTLIRSYMAGAILALAAAFAVTVSVNSVRKRMDCTFPTASKLIADFASRGWLLGVTGNERHRIWRSQPYLNLFPRDNIAP